MPAARSDRWMRSERATLPCRDRAAAMSPPPRHESPPAPPVWSAAHPALPTLRSRPQCCFDPFGRGDAATLDVAGSARRCSRGTRVPTAMEAPAASHREVGPGPPHGASSRSEALRDRTTRRGPFDIARSRRRTGSPRPSRRRTLDTRWARCAARSERARTAHAHPPEAWPSTSPRAPARGPTGQGTRGTRARGRHPRGRLRTEDTTRSSRDRPRPVLSRGRAGVRDLARLVNCPISSASARAPRRRATPRASRRSSHRYRRATHLRRLRVAAT